MKHDMRKIQFQKGDTKSIVLIIGTGLTGLISVLMVIAFLAYQRTREVEDIQKVQQTIGGPTLGNSTLQDTINDTKRTADLRTIQSALEMYRAENENYPSLLSDLDRYISPLPRDPVTFKPYKYFSSHNRNTYVLKAKLNDGKYLTIQSP